MLAAIDDTVVVVIVGNNILAARDRVIKVGSMMNRIVVFVLVVIVCYSYSGRCCQSRLIMQEVSLVVSRDR